MDKKIKIHGAMRSGTNFLEFMLKNNFSINVCVNEFTWKHFEVDINIPVNFFILTYKNVYSWLKSMHKFALTTNFFPVFEKNFSDFIRSKIIFKETYGLETNYFEYDNPIVWWNNYHEENLKYYKDIIFINYENFILSPINHLRKISLIIGEELKKTFTYPESEVLPHNVEILPKSEIFKYSKYFFYKNKKYLDSFNFDDFTFVKKNLNYSIYKELEKLKICNQNIKIL